MDWKLELQKQFPTLQFQMDESMARHTTFRIGGAAEVFVSPTIEQAISLVSYCRDQGVPYTILGNGSNVLVSDKGLEGLVISLGRGADQIEISGSEIRVEAGAMLSRVANYAAEHSLTGMEFATGIPGTIGGALMMNAGAYGGEMKDVVTSVDVLLPSGEVMTWDKEELGLSYRKSRMMEENAIVLRTVLTLAEGDKDSILEMMADFRQRRIDKQPLDFPSAGSTFKRPEGYFAGKLIMDAGLAGYQVGGARVSEKHCGFVINAGDAKAADIVKLMKDVSEKVEEDFGVTLEPEVRFLGEF